MKVRGAVVACVALAMLGPGCASAAPTVVPAPGTVYVNPDPPAPPPTTNTIAAATATALAVRLDPPEPPPPLVLTVEDMIRLVWPDNLEARALRIAYRESRYQCCVRTWCCYGIFQIHEQHLARLGLDNVQQLYDPMTNVEAAYRLYQLDGWSPWAT